MGDKIDFAGAWFDVCNEYLCNREAFLQDHKNPVGVGVVVSPVADEIYATPGGTNGVHQLDSLEHALKGVAGFIAIFIAIGLWFLLFPFRGAR